MMERNDIVIKPYTHQELALLYGVSWRTLQRWLKPFQRMLCEKNRHYNTTRQVRIIFNRTGWPPSSRKSESKAAA